MPLDIELPLWTFRPNWKDGVLERLSFLTDVLPSTLGGEQRRALRLSPRREFEMNFNPIDSERSYFELFLHRLGSFEFMLPLYHDRGKLTSAIAAGATDIPVDTAYREFTVGGLALILGDDGFTYDKVSIEAIDGDSITVAPGSVTRTWPANSSIYPLRRARVEQESAVSGLTSRVAQGTIRFELTQANDLEDEGEWDRVYAGLPVLTKAPNRREVIDLTFLRNSLKVDNDHGLPELGDDAGRAFTVQTHMALMRGRAEHMAFRQMLYRLRGQQGGLWLPTFNEDIKLARPAASADTRLNIKKIGYAYTGGAVNGRDYALIRDQIVRITNTEAPLSSSEERLVLSGAVGADLLAGSTGSWLETVRLATDDIEIKHHTDTDGVAECNLSFRAFRNNRVPPAVFTHPAPTADMSSTQCGTPLPEEADCVPFDFNEYGRIIFEWDHGPFIPNSHPFMIVSAKCGGVQKAYVDSAMGSFWGYETTPAPQALTATAFFRKANPPTGWELYCGRTDYTPNVEGSTTTGPFPCGSFINGPDDEAGYAAYIASHTINPAHDKVLEKYIGPRGPSGLFFEAIVRSWVKTGTAPWAAPTGFLNAPFDDCAGGMPQTIDVQLQFSYGAFPCGGGPSGGCGGKARAYYRTGSGDTYPLIVTAGGGTEPNGGYLFDIERLWSHDYSFAIG